MDRSLSKGASVFSKYLLGWTCRVIASCINPPRAGTDAG